MPPTDVTLAARNAAGPPVEKRCSICIFEKWLAEHHPEDVAQHLAWYDDDRWSDRLHAEALADEYRDDYARDISEQQLGVHRRSHR